MDSHSHTHTHDHSGGGQSHSHSHAQDQSAHDWAAANKEHFDNAAAANDARPEWLEMAQRGTAAMRKKYPDLFDEDKTALLDFACGTGLVSRELCPYVHSIVGVDVSGASVDQYNLRAQNQGLLPEEMKAVCAELKGVDGELDNTKFDVVVCAMAYHHFAIPADITRTLAFFMKPGATLLVTDILLSEAGEFLPDAAVGNAHLTVAHRHGFSEADIRGMFEGAGLVQVEFTPTFSAKMAGKDIRFFLARGVNPEAA